MERILILGGGVGGTLTANLLVRKLRQRRSRRATSTITVVDQTGQHVYQPGFMYIAMGGERAEQPPAPGARPARRAGRARRRRGRAGRRGDADRRAADGERLAYDHLVLATGSRIVPEEIEHFDDRGPPLLHRRGRRRASRRARRVHRRPDRHRHRRHALQVPAGAAGGRVPHRGRAARARPARPSELHFCSPIGRAFTIESVSEMATPILAQKGIELHTFFNVETIDPERKVVAEPRGRGAAVRPADPRPAAQGPAVPHRLRPRAGARRLAARPTARPSRSAVGRTSSRSATRPTCRCRRPARPPTSRRPSWPSGSPPRSRAARSTTKRGDYLGKVMCFFEIGDGKGTLLRFDYDHPPRPPKPNRLWHLGKIVFNKTYWHTVPKGRV